MKVAPTKMTLQLADPSITKPYGVVEDVLVKVRRFTIPVDFVIMGIEEDSDIPLILGRTFMLTAKYAMDMGNDNFEMSVEDQKVTFNLFEAIKNLSDSKTYFKVEAIEQENEAKPVMNSADPSIVFLGPRQVRARVTTADKPSLSSSKLE